VSSEVSERWMMIMMVHVFSVSEAVQTVIGLSLPEHVKSLQLDISCVDDSGSELQVPFVKYNFRSPQTPSTSPADRR